MRALTTWLAETIHTHLGDGPVGERAMRALTIALTPIELDRLLRNAAANAIQGLL